MNCSLNSYYLLYRVSQKKVSVHKVVSLSSGTLYRVKLHIGIDTYVCLLRSWQVLFNSIHKTMRYDGFSLMVSMSSFYSFPAMPRCMACSAHYNSQELISAFHEPMILTKSVARTALLLRLANMYGERADSRPL